MVYDFTAARRENPTAILVHDGDCYCLVGITVADLDFMEGGASEEEMQEIFPRQKWTISMMR